jgi:hypothetical protein
MYSNTPLPLFRLAFVTQVRMHYGIDVRNMTRSDVRILILSLARDKKSSHEFGGRSGEKLQNVEAQRHIPVVHMYVLETRK